MKTVNKLDICVDKQLKAAFNEIRENSSPGVSKIPTKILKASIKAIGPTLLHIFIYVFHRTRFLIFSSMLNVSHYIKKDRLST